MQNLFTGFRVTAEKIVRTANRQVVNVQNGYRKVQTRTSELNRQRRTGKVQQIIKEETKHKCKNCKALFSGKYCFNCGQAADTNRLTWRSVVDNIFGGLTNIASGFGFTIIELFTRPGYMINDFVRGKRIIYAKPFPMLFVLAALYALSFQLIYPPTLQVPKEETVQQANTDSLKSAKEIDLAIAELEALKKNANQKQLEEIKEGQKKLKKSKKQIENQENKSDFDEIMNAFGSSIDKFKIDHPYLTSASKTIYDAFTTNEALSAILILPFITLGMRRAFRKSKQNPHFNFVEMLFACCYMSCQGLIVAMLLLPFSPDKTLIHYLISILLSLWTLKELFGNSKRGTIRRYIFTYINVGLILFLAALLLAGMFALLVWIAVPKI